MHRYVTNQNKQAGSVDNAPAKAGAINGPAAACQERLSPEEVARCELQQRLEDVVSAACTPQSLLKADTLANKLFKKLKDEYLSLTDLKRPVVCVVCLESKLERNKELDAMNLSKTLGGCLKRGDSSNNTRHLTTEHKNHPHVKLCTCVRVYVCCV